jgi:hypothetical protein
MIPTNADFTVARLDGLHDVRQFTYFLSPKSQHSFSPGFARKHAPCHQIADCFVLVE